MINIDQFRQIDLRVAEVKSAERVPGTTKLLKLEIDLGYEQRTIVAGIAQWYTPEEMVGRKIVVVANLEPATIRGITSQGMLLAAGGREPGAPFSLVVLDRPQVPNGTRIE